MFTNNGVPGANAARQPLVEKAALGCVLALLAAEALQLPTAADRGPGRAGRRGAPCALAPVAALEDVRVPLVWVLHVAYAWIPVHLLLRALAGIGWVGAVGGDRMR